MADLNALIAQGAQFKQPESSLNMMAQLQQLQQSQSANQLNQINIAEKQRTIEEQGALRSLYARSAGKMESPEFLQQLAASSPSAYQAHLKFLDEQKKTAADIKYAGAKTGESLAKTGETEVDVAKKKKDFVIDSLSSMSFNPSDANIIAFAEDAVLNKYLTPKAAQAKVDELLGMPIPDRKVYLATQGLSSKDTAGLFESKPVEKSDGQNKWMEEGNPRLPNYGKRMVGPTDIKMLATPGEQLTASTAAAGQGVTMRGQNIGAETARLARTQSLELANRPVFSEASQGFIGRPTAATPGGTFTPLPAAQVVRDQAAAVKALKSAGYDPETGNDNISKLIEKSTSGRMQAGTAATLAFLGSTTEGRKAIAALEGTANQIAIDLAGGKLGASISNTDREFIVSALGDVANPSKTSEERLAGWQAAKQRMLNTGLIPPPKSAAPAANGKLSPAEQAELDALRKRFGK